MILQPARQTAACVATCTGGLLPRLLTLTHRSLHKGVPSQVDGSGHSLLCYYALTDIFHFESAAFCAVRTFLPDISVNIPERQADLLLLCLLFNDIQVNQCSSKTIFFK